MSPLTVLLHELLDGHDCTCWEMKRLPQGTDFLFSPFLQQLPSWLGASFATPQKCRSASPGLCWGVATVEKVLGEVLMKAPMGLQGINTTECLENQLGSILETGKALFWSDCCAVLPWITVQYCSDGNSLSGKTLERNPGGCSLQPVLWGETHQCGKYLNEKWDSKSLGADKRRVTGSPFMAY